MTTPLMFNGIEVPECDWESLEERGCYRDGKDISFIQKEGGGIEIEFKTVLDVYPEWEYGDGWDFYPPNIIEHMSSANFELLGARWALFFWKNQYLIPEVLKQKTIDVPEQGYRDIIFGADTFQDEYDHNKIKSDVYVIDGVSIAPASCNPLFIVLQFNKGSWDFDFIQSYDGQRHDNRDYIFAVAV